MLFMILRNSFCKGNRILPSGKLFRKSTGICHKNTIKLIAVYRKLQIFVDYNSNNVYGKDSNILFCRRKH